MSERSAVFILALQRLNERISYVRADSSADVWFDDILDQLVEHEQQFCEARYRHTKWQPIETAPMDGLRVLLYQADAREWGGQDSEPVFIGYWHEWPERRHTNAFATATNPGDWLDASGHGCWRPTHWMPLPEPPSI